VSAAACCTMVVAAPSAMQHTATAHDRTELAPALAASAASRASAATSATAGQDAAAPADSASRSPADPVARLQVIVGAQALDGLTLERSAQRVVVRGVLPSRSAVDQLNRQLDALPVDLPVGRRFVAAQDVVDRLYESLPAARLTVRHLYGAHFEVAGRVSDPVRIGAAIGQIAADLADYGVQVESALVSQHNTLPSVSGLLVDGQGNSFLRTRDGVKHIVAAAAAASDPVTLSTRMRDSGAGDTR
jgi:hypothetical protein